LLLSPILTATGGGSLESSPVLWIQRPPLPGLSAITVVVPESAALPTALFVVVGWGWGRGNITVGSGWSDASLPGLVKDQHGRAPLETGISSLARPISVARLS